MNEPSTRPLVRITRGIVPTALASGLLSPVAIGAPGDLDPNFGDMGRVASALKFDGPAWSVQPLAGDDVLFAGGDFYYESFYYAAYDSGYIGELSGTGALESQFSTAALKSIETRAIALQSDGKVIAVGREILDNSNVFTVLRLLPDGMIDTTFAKQGVLQQPASDGAQAVTLDPSGAIAVAGSSAGQLLVIRLLPNGTPDPSFGDAGVFQGASNQFIASDILRTPGGGYRISTNYSDVTGETGQCRVIGLTADGKLDNTFGIAGIAAPGTTPGASVTCTSMVAQSDGGLVLAGQQNGQGFAVRLLASGAADASFTASPVAAAMVSATALAVDAAGNIVVAGTPPPGTTGALLVRLQASGALDPVFGNAGTAWLDLSSIATPVVHDIKVVADGRVLAAGGDLSVIGKPFVVRLLGDTGTAGAGVVGVTNAFPTVGQKDQTASITVRRTGGATGAISVAYHTGDAVPDASVTATPGHDYTAVKGQLSWADGDRTDRLITVPITHPAGPVELSESFVVTLDSATGGAVFGSSSSVVDILGGGEPVGQFDLEVTAQTVPNTVGMITVVVNRNYYSAGATSVTVTPVAGSATGADFSITPVTLSWADGDAAPKSATIAITPGNSSTATKSFTAQLSGATNGAVIGPLSVETVTITYPTPPPGPSGGGGGGGGLDWLTLASFGLLRWLRRRAR